MYQVYIVIQPRLCSPDLLQICMAYFLWEKCTAQEAEISAQF
jgi:hypothetical protein